MVFIGPFFHSAAVVPQGNIHKYRIRGGRYDQNLISRYSDFLSFKKVLL